MISLMGVSIIHVVSHIMGILLISDIWKCSWYFNYA